MTFDLGLTRLWDGWGVVLPLVLFIVGAVALDQVAPSAFDGGSAFLWYGAFVVIALWTVYYLTGQHQK